MQYQIVNQRYVKIDVLLTYQYLVTILYVTAEEGSGFTQTFITFNA